MSWLPPYSHSSETGNASGIEKPTTQHILTCPHCSRCWKWVRSRTYLCTCTCWGSFLENKANLKFEPRFPAQGVWGIFSSSHAPILSNSSLMTTRRFDLSLSPVTVESVPVLHNLLATTDDVPVYGYIILISLLSLLLFRFITNGIWLI
jgi:hypothetical protein